MRNPERLIRLSRNSQLAKFGSIRTFKSVNWTRKDACPIHVNATWPLVNFGNTGFLCCPVRGVKKAFQTISRKKVRGLNAFEGVKSLKDLGIFRRVLGGRDGLSGDFDISYWYTNGYKRMNKTATIPSHLKMMYIR